MDVENSTQTSNEVKPADNKRVVATGVPYPVESLTDALTTINKLVAENGTGVVITKEDISKATGKTQGTLVLNFSTYQQYGILEKVHGKGFKTTPVFNKYHDKVYPNHEKEALVEMFKTPSLYTKIIEHLNQTNLPSEEKFPTLLKGEPYKVNANSADRAAKVFFENARFLNLIDSNNKLVLKAVDNMKPLNDNPAPPVNNNTPRNDEANMIVITIPMKNKTSKAELRFPEEYTNEDMDKIARIVQAYKEMAE